MGYFITYVKQIFQCDFVLKACGTANVERFCYDKILEASSRILRYILGPCEQRTSTHKNHVVYMGNRIYG